MKQYLLLLWLLIACNSSRLESPIPPQSKITDTFPEHRIRELFALGSGLDTIPLTDSFVMAKILHQRIEIDSMVKIELGYKGAIIDQRITVAKIKEIQIKLTKIRKYSDSIALNNKLLKQQVETANGVIKEERAQKKTILSQKQALQLKLEKAIRVSIAALDVKGIGVSKSLLGSSKEYETNKVSKIKKIRVSFLLPKNSLADTGKKQISVYIYSVDKLNFIEKDTTIKYTGDEKPVKLTTGTGELKAGPHLVEVFINDQSQVEYTWNIQ